MGRTQSEKKVNTSKETLKEKKTKTKVKMVANKKNVAIGTQYGRLVHRRELKCPGQTGKK